MANDDYMDTDMADVDDADESDTEGSDFERTGWTTTDSLDGSRTHFRSLKLDILLTLTR
jgi:hypothetical protein